ncbi:MAG: hypothetical protein IPP47_33170 [Bryobacterales bacterium]|nr:hypothetical protein [Bryobacterales bacterium]
MLYGCDHGGRGRDVTEFGDYFRTQRWMNGPGNDQPGLASDVIKEGSQLHHASLRAPAHVAGGLLRQQVGHHVGADRRCHVAQLRAGQNLLTLHGLYYSTHGGWWEWAPPATTSTCRIGTMGDFLPAVERMSYLLSQGVHRADVAILYPVAAMEAAWAARCPLMRPSRWGAICM